MFERLSKKLSDIVQQISGKAQISEKNIQDAIEEIKIALLEADVNLRVVRRFINQIVEEAQGEKVLRSVSPGQQFTKIVYDRMVQMLGDTQAGLSLKGPDTQTVILLVGLQGSGKTTTAAKLAVHLKKKGRKPLLIAADLVRPAAIEQLGILAEKAEVGFYKDEKEKDPVKVVKNGLKAANLQYDTVIVDTAGRLQIDNVLMQQLVDIRNVAKPEEVLLVADAMTGHNAVEIAGEFDKTVGLTGVILSKFDSDTRGGAALSIKSITGKPIKFIGMGEKIDTLEVFHPERIASRILGMGDIVTLVEKAQETINIEEALELQKKIENKDFTLEDLLKQIQSIKKMGNFKAMLEMIPGLKGQVDNDAINEKDMKRKEAIILSMTPFERSNYKIIGPSRRRRIAKGSGTAVFDVNQLLKQFEKTKLMMKKMAKNKKYQANMLSQLGM